MIQIQTKPLRTCTYLISCSHGPIASDRGAWARKRLQIETWAQQ